MRTAAAMVGLFVVCHAEGFAAGPMSVNQAVEEALANHLSLKTAAARAEAAAAAGGALWEIYAPQITVFSGVQRNQVNGETTEQACD